MEIINTLTNFELYESEKHSLHLLNNKAKEFFTLGTYTKFTILINGDGELEIELKVGYTGCGAQAASEFFQLSDWMANQSAIWPIYKKVCVDFDFIDSQLLLDV